MSDLKNSPPSSLGLRYLLAAVATFLLLAFGGSLLF